MCDGAARASERATGSAHLNFTARTEGRPVCLSGLSAYLPGPVSSQLISFEMRFVRKSIVRIAQDHLVDQPVQILTQSFEYMGDSKSSQDRGESLGNYLIPRPTSAGKERSFSLLQETRVFHKHVLNSFHCYCAISHYLPLRGCEWICPNEILIEDSVIIKI